MQPKGHKVTVYYKTVWRVDERRLDSGKVSQDGHGVLKRCNLKPQ